MATRDGRTEVISLLLEAGANTDLQNHDGDSALMMAVSSWSKTKVVPMLVKAGAALDLQNKEGDSAVIIATVRYHLPVLKELVRAGADLNLQNQEGLTALMISSRTGRTDLTEILLSGENISLDIQSVIGWSALFFAVDNGDAATTKLLLKAGADPFLGGHGLTAMDVASANTPAPTHSLFRTRSAEGRRHRAMHRLLSKHMKKPSKQKVSPAESSQEHPQSAESSQEPLQSAESSLEPPQSAESSQEHPQSAESSLEHPQSAESSLEPLQSAESSHELAESQESSVATRLSQSLLKRLKSGRQAAKQAFLRLESRVLRPNKRKIERPERGGGEGEEGVRRQQKPYLQPLPLEEEELRDGIFVQTC
ncbi:Putative ankyrin repeat protein MM_0045 [Geodia barretti]|uniref:Ankyrin repeat protein MM_0045 n=1 Tax=Geodia barretti TaxID=519541 RepID=A0AA35S335_GEOBA|nr:Putative ankyrin repeat protein MM_0045 [Geodia barretti]